MDTVFTHCDWHLGDNLVHLHYLRKVAVRHPERRFIHAANFQFLSQLVEAVVDIPNLSLMDLEYKSENSIDVWKNRNGFFQEHPNKFDYAEFYIDFFEHISEELNVRSQILRKSDFLFDYPGIKKRLFPAFDFLIINSGPMSLQFSTFSKVEFDDLIGLLLHRGYSVITTAPSIHDCTATIHPRLSISAIGGLSLGCKYIVGISTGPSWPTFNIWNTESVQLRILMLEAERVEIAPNTEHAESMPEVLSILKARGLV
jgi:hypothetical protein